MTRSETRWIFAATCMFAAAWAVPARAQDKPEKPSARTASQASPDDAAELPTPISDDDAHAVRREGSPHPALGLRPPSPEVWSALRPNLSGANLMWIAIVVILALTYQTRPLLAWNNGDALVLVLTCIALMLRANTSRIPHDPTNRDVQFWSYTLLTAFAIYWMVRGYRLLAAKALPVFSPNVTPGAMSILALAGLLVSLHTIVTAPLSDGSRDGLVGGVCLAETGKLPYGDAPGNDARSPLLYALHAGAVKAWPATLDASGVSWANRDDWSHGESIKRIDPTPARLVNALLFVLMFGGLAWLGHRLHSVALGLTIATIFCVFPGTIECLDRPEIMAPATLVTWSLAFLTLPGVGGLLSAFAMTLAGLAWPWAWLLLPVLLVYFFRSGWNGFGAAVGALAGVAGCGAMIFCLTAPSLPRVDGALEAAAAAHKYTALRSGNGEIVVNSLKSAEALDRDRFKTPLWEALLKADTVTLDPHESPMTLPPGVDASTVLYREIMPTSAAAAAVETGYRRAMEKQDFGTRLAANVRTVTEATWLPSVPRELPIASTWAVWPGRSATQEQNFIVARRATKIGVVVLGLLTIWPLMRGPRPQTHQVLGALLGVSAAILLASEVGAAGNLVWIMPTILAALAARAVAVPAPPAVVVNPLARPGVGSFAASAPVPRITVEN